MTQRRLRLEARVGIEPTPFGPIEVARTLQGICGKEVTQHSERMKVRSKIGAGLRLPAHPPLLLILTHLLLLVFGFTVFWGEINTITGARQACERGYLRRFWVVEFWWIRSESRWVGWPDGQDGPDSGCGFNSNRSGCG